MRVSGRLVLVGGSDLSNAVTAQLDGIADGKNSSRLNVSMHQPAGMQSAQTADQAFGNLPCLRRRERPLLQCIGKIVFRRLLDGIADGLAIDSGTANSFDSNDVRMLQTAYNFQAGYDGIIVLGDLDDIRNRRFVLVTRRKPCRITLCTKPPVQRVGSRQ